MTTSQQPCPFQWPEPASEWSKADRLHQAAAVLADRSDLAPASTLQRLEDARYLQQMLEEALAETVATARAEGASWADVGAALRMTRQAAQQRFGSAVPR